MEYYGRRNRRGRPRNRTPLPLQFVPRSQKKTLFNGLCSFLVLASLIAIVYLMLDYHCNICSKKCDLNNITKGIDDIAQNISKMKDSYIDLEKQMLKFSQELPKIEGQIEVLEALANTMEKGDFLWNSKTQYVNLPDKVFLTKPEASKTITSLQNATTLIRNKCTIGDQD